MLDQHPQEPLDGAQNHPVQHYRPVPRSIGAYVSQIESFRQSEITLNSRTLPPPVQSVFKLDVDFRPVESALAFAYLVRECIFLRAP